MRQTQSKDLRLSVLRRHSGAARISVVVRRVPHSSRSCFLRWVGFLPSGGSRGLQRLLKNSVLLKGTGSPVP